MVDTCAKVWRWPQSLDQLRSQFVSACPYPHIVLDNVFPAPLVEGLYSDIPSAEDPAWIHWGGGKAEECDQASIKRGISDVSLLPASIARMLELLVCDEFVADLGKLTGTQDLIVDPTFGGGGLHCSGRGAALRLHADPIRHPSPDEFDQAINLIMYLNPRWQEIYGGNLELWSRDGKAREVSVPPLFNRIVIFKADRSTFHGHPEPNRCPSGEYRASLALYYYVPREQRITMESNRPIWR